MPPKTQGGGAGGGLGAQGGRLVAGVLRAGHGHTRHAHRHAVSRLGQGHGAPSPVHPSARRTLVRSCFVLLRNPMARSLLCLLSEPQAFCLSSIPPARPSALLGF